MTDNKKYIINVGDEAEIWDSDMWTEKGDSLFSKYKDANVFELEDVDAFDEDPTDKQYLVNVEGEQEVWDADMVKDKGARLMEVYPGVSIQRLNYKDYWGDRAKTNREQRTLLAQPDEERNARLAELGYYDDLTGEAFTFSETGEGVPMFGRDLGLKPLSSVMSQSPVTGLTTYADPAVEEFFATDTYADRQAEIARLDAEYENNPSVIAYREYEAQWLAEQEKKSQAYRGDLLTSIDEIDRGLDVSLVAEGQRAKYAHYGLQGRYFASPEAVSEAAKAEKLQAAKMFLAKAEMAEAAAASEKGFWAAAKDFAIEKGMGAFVQGDIETYNEIGNILTRLESELGDLGEDKLTPEVLDQHMSPEDRALILSFLEYNAAMSDAQQDMRTAYKAGKIFAESVPFMLEFLVTGGVAAAGEGAAKGLAKGAEKAITKAFFKWATKNGAKRAARVAFAQGTKKVASGAIKALSGTLARTTVGPQTWKKAAEASVEIEDGHLHRGMNAFSGFMDAYIENLSEISGGLIGKTLGMYGVHPSKMLGKISFGKIGQMLADSRLMQGVAKGIGGVFGENGVLKKFGFNGIFEEVEEEYIGNLIRSASIQPGALKEMHQDDNFGAMLLGFAPMTLFGAGISAASMIATNVEASNLGKKLRETLGYHYKPEQIDHMMNVVSGAQNAEEVWKAIKPLAMGLNEEETKQLYQYGAFMAQNRAMLFAKKAQEDNLAQATRTRFQQTYGKFWQQNAEGAESVQLAELRDGRTVYVTSEPTADGMVSIVDVETGKAGFTNVSEYAEHEENGAMVPSTRTWDMKAYIEGEIASERSSAQEARMAREYDEQVKGLQSQIKQGTRINLGTETSPIMMLATGKFVKDGVIAVDQTGNTHTIGWNQVADAMGQPIRVKTDQEIIDEEVAAVVERRAQRRKQMRNATPAMTDAVNESAAQTAEVVAQENKHIPMNPDGTVNEAAFWEQDPEGYAAWNDEQNQDGGADTREQIAISKAMLAQMLKDAIASQQNSNPAVRKQAKKNAEDIQAQIDRLTALEAKYEEQRVAPFRERAMRWKGLTNAPVHIVETAEELAKISPSAAASYAEDMRVRGIAKDGRAYIFLPGIVDATEIDAVFMHEAVAHSGLKGLLGQQAFDQLCDQVWEMMSPEARQVFIGYPGVNGDKRAAADEYIAHVAETIGSGIANEEAKTIWQKIVDFVRNILRRMGVELSVSESELSDLLSMAYADLAKNMAEAEKIAAKNQEAKKAQENAAATASQKYDDYMTKGLTAEEIKAASENELTAAQEEYDALMGTAPKVEAKETAEAFIARKKAYNEKVAEAKAKLAERQNMMREIAKREKPAAEEAAQTPEVVDNIQQTEQPDGSFRLSMKTYNDWTDNLGMQHKGTRSMVAERMVAMKFSDAEINDMLARMDTMYQYMEKLQTLTNEDGTVRFDEFNRWAETTPLYKQVGRDYVKAITSLVSNGDYPINMELTTDCIKREAFTMLLNTLVKRGADLSKMGPGEIVTIQKMMNQYGIEVACKLCFVEGKRLQIINWASQIVEDWNNALVEAGVTTDEYFEFGKDGDAFLPAEEWRTHEDKSEVLKMWRQIDEIEMLFQGIDPKQFKEQQAKNQKAIEEYKKKEAEKWAKKTKQPAKNWVPTEKQETAMAKLAKEGLAPTYVNENMEEYRNAFNAMRNEWLEQNPGADPLSFTPTQKQWEALGKIRNRQIDTVRAKMVRLIMEYPEMRKKMTLNDLLGSKGLMEIRQQHGQAYADLYSIILQRFGTGTPKPVQDAVPYDGELMTLTEAAFKKANEIGGARLFSFSDFDITKVFDYMQMFFDLEANRQMLQSYTKEVAAVIIFGRSNAKFNISTLANAAVPQEVLDEYAKAKAKRQKELKHQWAENAGLIVDAAGNITGINFSEEHSVSPAFAQQIFHDEARNKDCGAIMVGASVNHAIYSAAQAWIRMVIPFHLSGMPKAAQDKTDVKWYFDNTPFQSTRKKVDGKWTKISSSEDTFKFYDDMTSPKWNMRDKTRQYLAWCQEHGYRPKFDWGINSDYYRAYCKEQGYEPNQQIIDIMDADTTDGVWNQYYKFLTDFTAYKPVFNEQGEMIDEIPSPQLPVQSNFDFSEMEKDVLFEGEKSMLGHREENIKKAERHMDALAAQVVPFLNGDITEAEMGLKDNVFYKSSADAEAYLETLAEEQDNARLSVITPAMDKDYMDAVEAGDMETAQRMVNEAAKLAMPNTKVVDENGNPKVVYHGSPNTFFVFNTDKEAKRAHTAEDTHFFTDDKEVARGYGKELYPVFLNITEPIVKDFEGNAWNNYEGPITPEDLKVWEAERDARKERIKALEEKIEQLKNEYESSMSEDDIFGLGDTELYQQILDTEHELEMTINLHRTLAFPPTHIYSTTDKIVEGARETSDGAIFENVRDAASPEMTHKVVTDYVAYKPSQIKSADPVTYDDAGNVIPLSERFNPENGDIRFSVIEPHQSSMDEIDTMFREYNADQALTELYDKVSALARTMDLKIRFDYPWSDAAGSTFADKVKFNTEFFNSLEYMPQDKARGLLHEMIHAVTQYAIFAKNTKQITPGMKEAVKQLEDVYEEIKNDSLFAGTYGAKSVHEMVAELANPEFRDRLKAKNLYQRIVDAIKKLLGIEVGDNALDNVSATLDYMIDNYDGTLFNAVANALGQNESYVRFSVLDTSNAELKAKPIKLNGMYRFRLKDAFKGVKDASGRFQYTKAELYVVDERYDGPSVKFDGQLEGFATIYVPQAIITEGEKDNVFFVDPKNIESQLWDALKAADNYYAWRERKGPHAVTKRIGSHGYEDWTNADKQDVRFSVANESQSIFVSNAAKAVEGIKMEKATPAQWLAMIEKNGGLKAGEDKWMGLSDWLKASDKKTLTKAEVLDFIGEHMIQIEETHYDAYAEEKVADAYAEMGRILQDKFNAYRQEYYEQNEDEDLYGNPANDYAIERLREELGDEFPYAIEVTGAGDVYLTFPYEEDEDMRKWSEKLGVEYNPKMQIYDTRLTYTTDGLTNKREIALTVPTIESWNESDLTHFGDAGEGRAVAWIRFGETTTESGEKVLVIDEIQSKRHQEGREKGYAPSKEDVVKATEAFQSFNRAMREKYGDGVFPSKWSEADQAEFDRLRDEHSRIFRGYDRGVPAAPFEKNWHELAMKRMLRYAAENGYDYIAWTKGEQQAERYNISGVVEDISHHGQSLDGRFIDINFKNWHIAHLIVDNNGKVVTEYNDEDGNFAGEFTGKTLEEIMGKELAEKVMSMKEDDVLETDDLKVGGEGMKGFYDKMLPAFMNKYGKKWGVKVSDMEFPNLEDGLTMHSVPVTDEMKASVMEGQVMFSAVQIDPAVRQEMDTIKAKAMWDGTFMKAPNGADTNLTEEQWLMVRTKNFINWFGDWINDPANASKIVDENGEPMVMVHGSPNKFTIFRRGKGPYGSSGRGMYFGRAPKDLESHTYGGENGYKYLVFLNVRNLFNSSGRYLDRSIITNDAGKRIPTEVMYEIIGTSSYEQFIESVTDVNGKRFELYQDIIKDISKEKYQKIHDSFDGKGMFRSKQNIVRRIFRKNKSYLTLDHNFIGEIVVRDPNQIKSATETTGKFSESGDIRFSAVEAKSLLKRMQDNAETLTPRELTKEIWAGEIEGKVFVTPVGEVRFGENQYDKNIGKGRAREFGMLIPTIERPDLIFEETDYDPSAERQTKYVFVKTFVDEAGEKHLNYASVSIKKDGMEVITSSHRLRDKQVLNKIEKEQMLWNRFASDSTSSAQGGSTDQSNALSESKGTNNFESASESEEKVVADSNEASGTRFSVRTNPAPVKTQDVYKLMRLGKDGKLYPLFIGSAEAIELGIWYDADSPNLGDLTKLATGIHLVNNETGEAMTLEQFKAEHPEIGITGKRPNVEAINWATANGMRWIEIEDKAKGQKRYGGEARSYFNLGINGSGQVGQFAMRPGWHAGSLPTMRQIGKGADKYLRDDSFVWVKGRVPADIDYQAEADANPDKDIPTHIPTDGYYMKATNANAAASQADRVGWYVAGSFVADEIISDEEARRVITEWNEEHPDAQVKYDFRREGGMDFVPEVGMVETTLAPAKRAEDVVAEGLILTDQEFARLAGDIFAALPKSWREEVTGSLADILGLEKDMMQIVTRLAEKESWTKREEELAKDIRNLLMDIIDPSGIDINRPLTTKEALWMLYNALETETDIVSEAKRSVVAHNLGFDAESAKVKAMADAYGRYSVVRGRQIDAATEMYNYEANLWTSRLKESWLDMNQSVIALQNALAKASGKPIASWEDVVLALNQLSSKSYADKKRYMRDFLQPLWDAVMDIVKNGGGSIEKVERYMMLKHGLERNEKFAKRDAKQFYREMFDKVADLMKTTSHAEQVVALSEANKRIAEIDAELLTAKGKKAKDLQEARKRAEEQKQIAELVLRGDEAQNESDLQMYFDAIDAENNPKYAEFRDKDYGGLTSMFQETIREVKRKDYKTEEAYQKALMESVKPKYDTVAEMEDHAKTEVFWFEKDHKTRIDNLWKRVNAATKEVLRHQHASGVITTEQYDAVRTMFEFYVPLRGFADNTAEDMYSYYMNNSAGGFAKPIIAAKGRKTKAESPLGWIGTMAESAIQQDNKNEVKMKLYYALMNRTDTGVLSLSEMWYVFDHVDTTTGRKVFVPAYPPAPSKVLSADELRQHMDAWEASMKAKQAVGEAYKSEQKVDLHGSVIFQDTAQSAEHVIRVKVAGRDYSILVNGNPRAAQAINGLLNPDSNVGPVGRWIGALRRGMSSLMTSFSPLFWVANYQRDLLSSFMRTSESEGWGQAFKYLLNRAHAWRVAKYVYAYENGTMGDSYYENLYKEFAENGGITGYTFITTNKEYEKLLEDYAKHVDQKTLNWIRGAWDKFMGFGEAIEQVSRFAAYLTARESGKSIEESVAAAKEVSVNFNRKGSAKPISLEELDKLRDKNGEPLSAPKKWMAIVLSAMPKVMKEAYFFFNASIQALSSSAKLAKKSPGTAMIWAGMYMGVSMGLAAINYLLAGDDDENDYLNLPDYLRHSTALIKVSDEYYFKWSLPQEMRPFYAFADILLSKAMGKMPHKTAKDVGKDIALAMAEWLPVNPFGTEDPLLALVPDVFAPFAEIKANQNSFGSKIYNDMPYMSESVAKEIPAYRKATSKTGGIYVDIAEILNDLSGGDEVQKGAININPSIMEHLAEGYGGGIYDFAKMMIALPGLIIADEPVEVRDIPFVNKVILSTDETNMYSHTNEAFYHYEGVSENAKRVENEYRKSEDPARADAYRREDDWRIYLLFKQYEEDLETAKEKVDSAVDEAEKDLALQEQNVIREMLLQDIARGVEPSTETIIKQDLEFLRKQTSEMLKPFREAEKEREEAARWKDEDAKKAAKEKYDLARDTPEYKKAMEIRKEISRIDSYYDKIKYMHPGPQRDSVIGLIESRYKALVEKAMEQ